MRIIMNGSFQNGSLDWPKTTHARKVTRSGLFQQCMENGHQAKELVGIELDELRGSQPMKSSC